MDQGVAALAGSPRPRPLLPGVAPNAPGHGTLTVGPTAYRRTDPQRRLLEAAVAALRAKPPRMMLGLGIR